MVEDAYPTAPEGPLATDVRLNGAWPWIAVILGAAIIVIGGLLQLAVQVPSLLRTGWKIRLKIDFSHPGEIGRAHV